MKKSSCCMILLFPILFAANGCALLRGHSANLGHVRLLPSQPAQTGPANALATARSMLAKEDYISAIGLFRQIPSQAPEAAAAANGLAIAYDALGRNDLAQRYFEQAMGLDSANESYRRNYARFTDKTRSPILAEGVTRPAGNAIAALVKDRSTLARMSLSDVRLQTLSPVKATAALAPPAEIRLSLAGSAPKLDAAPGVFPPRASPNSRPVFSATAFDLAQAVRAARLRISPAGNGVAQTPRCSDSGASSCAS